MKKQSRLFLILATTAAIAIVVMGGFLAKNLLRQGIQTIRDRQLRSPPSFAESSWAHRTIEDIGLDAPFAFRTAPKLEMSQRAREFVDRFESYQSQGTPSSIAVVIKRTTYKPLVIMTLDSAVHQTMTGAAAANGDKNPKYSSAPASISGLQARTASYTGTLSSGRTLHVDAAFACSGLDFWQVQIYYVHEESAPLASRILRSIVIKP